MVTIRHLLFLSCRGPRTEDEADAALKMPTLPPSLSPSKKSSSLDNNSKRSISSNEKKVNHNGEWLGVGEKGRMIHCCIFSSEREREGVAINFLNLIFPKTYLPWVQAKYNIQGSAKMVPRLRETRPPRPEEARTRELRNLGDILEPIPVEW